jgi:hypothetical protein
MLLINKQIISSTILNEFFEIHSHVVVVVALKRYEYSCDEGNHLNLLKLIHSFMDDTNTKYVIKIRSSAFTVSESSGCQLIPY